MSQQIRYVLAALSLANLLLLEEWEWLISPLGIGYHAARSPGLLDYLAAMVNVLALGTAAAVLGLLLARSNTARSRAASGWVLFLLLVIPLNSFRAGGFPMQAIGVAGALFLLQALRPEIARRIIVAGLLAFSPYVLVTFGTALYRIAVPIPEVARGDHTIELSPIRVATHPSRPRVLVLVFDELDYRTVFESPPTSHNFPNLTRFKEQSFGATQATAPSSATIISLPALTTGLDINGVRVVGSSTLQLESRLGGVSWSASDSMFRSARKRGLGVGIVGWYHPWGRLFGDQVDYCSWETVDARGDAPRSNFAAISAGQLAGIIPLQSRLHHAAIMSRTADRMVEVAPDPRIGLLFGHLPMPHRPWVYDGGTGGWNYLSSGPRRYFDNVLFVDRTLGRIDAALSQAGLAEETTVVLTADHWWRQSVEFDGVLDRRVPYFVRVNGDRSRAVVNETVSNRSLRALVEALLAGEIQNNEDAAKWVRANPRATKPVIVPGSESQRNAFRLPVPW